MFIEEYPYTFELSGETWELGKNLVRRIKKNGEENKLALSGNIVGVEFSENLDEYVIIIDNLDGTFFIMSKKIGWLGPFDEINSVEFDKDKGLAVIVGKKNGENGKFDVLR